MKTIASIAILAFPTASLADAIPFVEASNPPGLPGSLRSWDVKVSLTNGVSLPRFGIDAISSSGEFADPVPTQDLYQPGGPLADTFFTATSAPPNPPTGGFEPGFSFGPVINPLRVQGNIIDFGLPPDDGDYIITRILSTRDAVFELEVFISSSINPSGRIFEFTVPAPSTVLPLTAAICLATRRRRA